MKQNLKLLLKIREAGMRQVDYAKAVGETPSYVSRVINGWLNLDPVRQARFSKVLGCKPSELFED